jgi:hypothetical protein
MRKPRAVRFRGERSRCGTWDERFENTVSGRRIAYWEVNGVWGVSGCVPLLEEGDNGDEVTIADKGVGDFHVGVIGLNNF